MNKIKTALYCFIAFFVCACASVQYTNRKAFIIVSQSEEIALGEQAFEQVKKESKLSADAEKIKLIENVGRRISAAANKPEYKWEFLLIDAPDTINAFALPGGKVAFYTGILPLCKDENGVAVVMGHEIAHAIARHGAERMSQGMAAGLVGSVLAAAVSEKTPEAQQALLGGYGLATSLGVMLPFSRQHEYEADYIGMILMAKAGFDPQNAFSFWKTMSEKSKGGKPPEFLSTHPSDNNRIEEIQKRLPEVLSGYFK